MIPIVGTFAAGKNRERLGRYTQDMEIAYQKQLETINEIVDNIKRDHRIKSDARKSELTAYREHLNLESEKFKAIRGMEQRLLIKKEQEEKSKKRIEDKLIRNKLLVQQAENKARQEAEIAAKSKARLVKDQAEIRAKGWDRIDMSVQGMRIISPQFYDNEDARIKFSYCELLDLSRNMIEVLPGSKFLDQFGALKSLKLSQNRLRDLPEDIRICEHLEILFLDTNRLHKLPSGICSLRNLQNVDISNNQLTGLTI